MAAIHRPEAIVLATANAGKVREIRRIFSGFALELLGLDAFEGVGEAPETGSTFAENARQKALYYARHTGRWSLAEDSGLMIDALDGRPGVYSARFAAEDCPPDATREQIDAANNRRVLAELAGVGACMRTARFVSHAVLVAVDGDAAGTEEPRLNIIAETEGTCEGRITFEPAGTGGFGYDPLFFLPELGRTTAELPPEEKNAVSHRGRAMRRMAERLGELLDTGRN